jgi:hypothetical protein
MQTIVVPLEDEIYLKAHSKAIAAGTSVPEVIAEYLRHWAVDEGELDQARQAMKARFAQPDWQFSVGKTDDRSQRNARR